MGMPVVRYRMAVRGAGERRGGRQRGADRYACRALRRGRFDVALERHRAAFHGNGSRESDVAAHVVRVNVSGPGESACWSSAVVAEQPDSQDLAGFGVRRRNRCAGDGQSHLPVIAHLGVSAAQAEQSRNIVPAASAGQIVCSDA